jgi:toxin ParE1/3/4
MRCRISRPAQNDIDDIWDYIAQDNPAAAKRFAVSLGGKFFMLAKHPRAGRGCNEIAAGLLHFPIGNYVIFYRIGKNYVEIVRILHGARDMEEIFDPRDNM